MARRRRTVSSRQQRWRVAALVVREALRDLASAKPSRPPCRRSGHRTVPRRFRPPGGIHRSHRMLESTSRCELVWKRCWDGAPASAPWARRSRGIEYRALELSAFAAASLSLTERDAYGALRLRRNVLGLRAGREFRLSHPVTLSVWIFGRDGSVRAQRSTARELR